MRCRSVTGSDTGTLIARVLLAFVGGPVLLILGGYTVAHWHTVIAGFGSLFSIAVVWIIIEMVRQGQAQRATRPRFDADAAARAAFAVDQSVIPRHDTRPRE